MSYQWKAWRDGVPVWLRFDGDGCRHYAARTLVIGDEMAMRTFRQPKNKDPLIPWAGLRLAVNVPVT